MNNDNDMIEILDDINEENTGLGQNPINNTQQLNQQVVQNNNVSQNTNNGEINYEPIENKKEEITIEQESKSEGSKSGLGFVIVLFIIIGAFIVALPYIAKFFR